LKCDPSFQLRFPNGRRSFDKTSCAVCNRSRQYNPLKHVYINQESTPKCARLWSVSDPTWVFFQNE
jgi:hypothetical protein